jgi:alpha-tubulin suppressor-like RCC1 family protein
MRRLQSKAVVALSLAAIIVAACGSSPTAPTDPVGGVAVAFETAKSGGILKQFDLVTCLSSGGALGNSFSGLFGGLTGDALAAAGISADDLSGAWKLSFDDLKTTQTSLSGTTATVHVSVKVTSEVDAGKLRDLVKKYGATQGIVPDDATIDAAIQAKLGGQLKMSETIDKDISVVQQDGKWVACGSSFGTAAGVTPAPVATAAPSEAPQVTEAPTSVASTPAPTSANGSATIPNVSGSTVAITAGNGFACALISDGSVKCWGKNDKGQLGDGTTTDSSTPVSPSGLGAGVKSIAVDPFSSFACAVSAAGAVKCWGSDTQGAGILGNGSLKNSNTPIDVVGLESGASSVAVSTFTACAVMSGGNVKCWGKNDQGQLGNNDAVDSGVPVDVKGLAGATAVVLAQGYSCALTSGGGVKCWGRNDYANLGNGSTTSSKSPVDVVGLGSGVKSITLGNYDNCALTSGGGVKCWGGTNTIPVDVAGLTAGVRGIVGVAGQATCALMNDGRVMCWGSDRTPKDSAAQLGGTFAALAVGSDGSGRGANVTCFLTTSGGVACGDQNGLKEITGLTPGSAGASTPGATVGAPSGAVTAVSVGFQHSCVVTTAGGVKCWGNDPGNGTTNSKTPVDVLGLTSGVSAVVVGTFSSCALSSTGGVKCWGMNTYNQLGNGTTADSTIPVDVTGLGSGVAAISAGGVQACAVTADGSAKCWGQNIAPTPVAVAGLTAVAQISVGDNRICALSRAGAVKCWTYPQAPKDVTGFTAGVKAFDADSGCASFLAGGVKCSGGTADLSSLSGVMSGISGFDNLSPNACAITATGGVKCWGDRNLGNGTAASSKTPVDAIGLGTGVLAISVGADGICAITAEHVLKCWGGDGIGSLPGSNTIPTLFPGL